MTIWQTKTWVFVLHLFNRERDQASNLMIINLLRNDVGKVCEHGNVTKKDVSMLTKAISMHIQNH